MTVRVQLEPMSGAEFEAWAAHSVSGFAAQQVDAGLLPPAEAAALAEQVFAEQLPHGLSTPEHHLFRAVDPVDGAPVGQLWLRVRPGPAEVEGYVFDVELLPAARGRGLGRATMLAGEDAARALGVTVMRLNVFGHNTTATRLYESLGYAVAGAALHRRLDGDEGHQVTGGAHVELREMTPQEYAAFRPGLADDLARLLPAGLGSPGHLLWTAYDGGQPVGLVWVHLQERSDGLHAFGYRVEVREDLRRRGYGRAVVEATLDACRDRAVRTMHLSVSVFDAGARRFYEDVGFTLTAQTMVKAL